MGLSMLTEQQIWRNLQRLLAWSSGDEGSQQDYKVKDQVFKSRGSTKENKSFSMEEVWFMSGVDVGSW